VADAGDGLDAFDAAAERAEEREPDLRAPQAAAVQQVLAQDELAEHVQAGPEEVAPLAIDREGDALDPAPRAAGERRPRLAVAGGQPHARRPAPEPVLDTRGHGLRVVHVQLVLPFAVEDAGLVAEAAEPAVQRSADFAADVAQRAQHLLLLTEHGRAVED